MANNGLLGVLISIMCRPPPQVFDPTAYAKPVSSLIATLWAFPKSPQEDRILRVANSTKAVPLVMPTKAYSLPVVVSNQPQMSLPSVPFILSSETRALSETPEHAKSTALPPMQSAGPVDNSRGLPGPGQVGY